MHHPRRSTRAALLVGALALMLAPDAAHAQLGGLKRRLGEKVGKAVLGEESAGRSAAPTFTDRVLEIDEARLDQLLRGLKVEAAEAQKSERAQAAENAKMAEQQKRNEAYAGCSQPYAKELLRYTGMTMGLALAAKREQDKTGKMSGPVQDSLQAVTARMIKVKDDMVAKCGEGPKESSFDAMSGSDEGTDPQALGARASGLKTEQYAVLRERVAAFLAARDGRTGSYVFAAGERALLDRRAAELAPFRKLLG
jgi:hypothetical protein